MVSTVASSDFTSGSGHNQTLHAQGAFCDIKKHKRHCHELLLMTQNARLFSWLCQSRRKQQWQRESGDKTFCRTAVFTRMVTCKAIVYIGRNLHTTCWIFTFWASQRHHLFILQRTPQQKILLSCWWVLQFLNVVAREQSLSSSQSSYPPTLWICKANLKRCNQACVEMGNVQNQTCISSAISDKYLLW